MKPIGINLSWLREDLSVDRISYVLDWSKKNYCGDAVRFDAAFIQMFRTPTSDVPEHTLQQLQRIREYTDTLCVTLNPGPGSDAGRNHEWSKLWEEDLAFRPPNFVDNGQIPSVQFCVEKLMRTLGDFGFNGLIQLVHENGSGTNKANARWDAHVKKWVDALLPVVKRYPQFEILGPGWEWESESKLANEQASAPRFEYAVDSSSCYIAPDVLRDHASARAAVEFRLRHPRLVKPTVIVETGTLEQHRHLLPTIVHSLAAHEMVREVYVFGTHTEGDAAKWRVC